MVFISAGHNSQSKTIKTDPGAVGNGYKEGDLTIEFRNLVLIELDKLGVKYITDSEEENLSMYLSRIKTGTGSVVIEYHFDAAENPLATGTTSIVEMEADRMDRAFAREIAETTAAILGIDNRGVKTEAETHRGRLGLMREEGLVCLCEIGFITNKNDMDKYQMNKKLLARMHATIISKFEDIF